MPNDINNTSPDFRDFLLNRNLILADTLTKNGLSSLAVGLGEESSLETLPNAVRASEDIEEGGNLFRKTQTLKNQYISNDDMVSANIINNNYNYNQIEGGYLDNNNNLNLGGPSTQPYDVIGAIVKGTGFGLTSDGLEPQFDIRSSLAGRVLGQTGLIQDTPLGGIAAEQLLLALGQRNVFNIQKELNEQFNLRPTSLIKGDPFLKTKWDVTVPSEGGFLGKVFDTALHLSGFEKPKSVIDSGGSIFQDDNGFLNSTVDRNNSLILNTGKGQLTKLFELLNKNYYRPDYKVDDGKTKLGVTGAESYMTSSPDIGITENVNYISPSGLKVDFNVEQEFDGSQNLWDEDIKVYGNSKSLLSITKSLFTYSEDNIRVPLNAQFKETMASNVKKTQLTTPVEGKLSKGSGVLNNDNVFCRTFTTKNTYGKVDRLQKNSGLISYKNKIRNNVENSVLGNNGFVKITPYNNPVNSKKVSIEKFMFSIENLAWDGESLANLPKNEIGPGDTTTGTRGRIMWFPPYGLKFSDTTAVNWDSTTFIGRGEPIYTYNNTERSGTLEFKVIIDYPDYVNDKNLDSDKVRASIAAGCDDYLSTNEASKIKEDNLTGKKEVVTQKQPEPDRFEFYFANDLSILLDGYEASGDGNQPINTPSNQTYGDTREGVVSGPWDDKYDYGLNKPWLVANFISDLKAKLANDSSSVHIKINGYASSDGAEVANLDLSKKRAETIKQWVLDNLGDSNDKSFIDRVKIDSKFFGETKAKNTTGTVDSLGKKIDRKVIVGFKYVESNDKQIADNTEIKKEVKEDKTVKQTIRARFHNEAEYFKELEENDKFLYDTIKEKVQFFQPAFHSITPEGFNSRLTFLQQCTRQGPSIQDNGAQNLAFGAPPVCILRIGDFYHTKIVMNNLSLTYEPLVWDLNPEGVGVQPMIANVNISFKFLGGSSLNGPINKLQNAVTFNFFGNNEIYDPRADSITLKKGKKAEKSSATIKKGDSLIVGSIKEGDKILGLRMDRTTTPIVGKTKPITNDATTVLETELSKPVAETSLNNDKEILSSFEWTVTNDNDNIIFHYGNNEFENLSKPYNIRFNFISTCSQKKMLSTSTIMNDNSNTLHEVWTSWNDRLSGIIPDSNGDIPLNFIISNSDLKVSTTIQYYFAKVACDAMSITYGQLLNSEENRIYKEYIKNNAC